jgi:hypothetical protein
MSHRSAFAVLGVVLWIGGCASLSTVPVLSESVPGNTAEDGKAKEKKPPKTLLEWTLGKKDDQDAKEKEGGKDKENGKGGKQTGDEKDRQTANERTKEGQAGDEGKENANGEEKQKDEEEEPKRIDPDRPHLPEASTTVGLGRAVLEAGYTYNTSGGFFPMHSFPEALLRVGMFADWFELRIGQNLVSATTIDDIGVRSITTGAEDLQLGVKLALTEQQKCQPESALLVQMTVPTGSKGLTANRVLPGVHYDCSWEIIKDLLSVETVLLADGSVDDHGHTFTLMGDGVTVAYDVTKKLEAFGELDSFYATGDSAAPQHYFVGGLVYFITRNCEIDCRAGVGLNAHADGYLAGSGFAVRY